MPPLKTIQKKQANRPLHEVIENYQEVEDLLTGPASVLDLASQDRSIR